MASDERTLGEIDRTNRHIQKLLHLTKRESEILSLVAREKSSKEIANELHLSRRTVENHRYRICKKLDPQGPGALVQWVQNVNFL